MNFLLSKTTWWCTGSNDERGATRHSAVMIRRLAAGAQRHLPIVILCIAIFGFYEALIYYNPIIYWNDAHIRWALRSQLVLGRWLPGIQVFVLLASKITTGLFFVRSLFTLLAILSLVCGYVLVRYLFSPLTGLIACAFLALNMMFAALAIVPYPDVLFVGLGFVIFRLLDEPVFTRRFYFGILLLNLASLTRYEGWFLSAFFMIDVALRSFHAMHWKAAIWVTWKMSLLCSIAPLAWLALGLSNSESLIDRLWSIFAFVAAPASPQLSDHILGRLNPEYLREFSSHFFHLLNWQIHPEFLALGMMGFLFAVSEASQRAVHWRILSFLVLDWCLLAFLQPWGFGSLRQPFVWQAFIMPYAAYGLVKGISGLGRWLSVVSEKPRLAGWITASTILAAMVLSARLIPSTTRFIAESSREADFRIPFEIGNWLNTRLGRGDAILILDDTDYYPYALATYVQYPFERILDDRLDARLVQGNLARSRMVYVIDLYKSRDGLSPMEIRLLQDLESGRIQAEQFAFDPATVWYVAANQLPCSP